ncbi:hypothetical protein MMC25_000519 [Agyrium rufum]|nr:hypothetical protein [Agyrium rufum]
MLEQARRQDEHEAKRRKVRKGTQSCWECRRRKVRCLYATPTNSKCDICARRGTACISQEYPEGTVPPHDNHEMVAWFRRPGDSALSSTKVVNTPGVHGRHDSIISGPGSSPPRVRHSLPTVPSPPSTSRNSGKHESICQALAAVWPSQHDLDIICQLPVGLSAHLHSGILCAPCSTTMGENVPSPREILRLPSLDSHPVLIARKLLILGTFLQGVLPSSMQDLERQGMRYRDIMTDAVEKAVRLVTTDENLIRSVEGLECILIESVYHNYAGNLHQAWMAVRRGVTVAQLMALNRGRNSPSLRFLESATRASFDPDHIWFRLIEMDRYLSITLGLPQASTDSCFASPKALEKCEPVDRVQRIHCAVAGRILQRNDTDTINLAETREIDELLQKAAAEMPPQWWLMPNSTYSGNDSAEIARETIRLMDQFGHYHLLIRLHLPYMLRSTPDHKHEHSKITAVNASRETLLRFVAFRTSNSAHFYCRGCDFLALAAAVVLCIAHIDSHRSKRQIPENASEPSATFNFLSHSRPSDRGIMERSLDIIETMARDGNDAISSKLARIIVSLLEIEASAADGTMYTAKPTDGKAEDVECDGTMASGGKALHVYIPYLGAINFEGHIVSKPAHVAPPASKLGAPSFPTNDTAAHNEANGPTHPITNYISQSAFLPSPRNTPSTTDEAVYANENNPTSIHIPASEDFISAEDDWDLQGVDLALFDSLFRGSAFADAGVDDVWGQWADNVGYPHAANTMSTDAGVGS